MDPLSDTFDDFVDDLLYSDIDILKGELDFLLIQYLFNSIDLKVIKTNEFGDIDSLAAWFFMKFLYEKVWYPFFGNILSKFVFLIEGKKQDSKNKKDSV
mgnify:CR=1 FL=1